VPQRGLHKVNRCPVIERVRSMSVPEPVGAHIGANPSSLASFTIRKTRERSRGFPERDANTGASAAAVPRSAVKRAFTGETPFATMSAIVCKEPAPMQVPAALERSVRGCLAKQTSAR
jgi:hypothetical protein